MNGKRIKNQAKNKMPAHGDEIICTAKDEPGNYESKLAASLQVKEVLEKIKNINLEDISDELDEDIKCGALSYEPDTQLYHNLESLDVKEPLLREHKPKIPRIKLIKDPLPERDKMLQFSLGTEHVFKEAIEPSYPEPEFSASTKGLYNKMKEWNN